VLSCQPRGSSSTALVLSVDAEGVWERHQGGDKGWGTGDKYLCAFKEWLLALAKEALSDQRPTGSHTS